MNLAILTDATVLKESGDFLLPSQATDYLDKFFEFEGPGFGGDPRDQIVSGQVVGLKKLQTFLTTIDAYNINREEKDQIIAVRIYSSISDRIGSSIGRALDHPDKQLKDVVLEPVLYNGKDLHKGSLPGAPVDNLILGRTLPCPTVCSLALSCP